MESSKRNDFKQQHSHNDNFLSLELYHFNFSIESVYQKLLCTILIRMCGLLLYVYLNLNLWCWNIKQFRMKMYSEFIFTKKKRKTKKKTRNVFTMLHIVHRTTMNNNEIKAFIFFALNKFFFFFNTKMFLFSFVQSDDWFGGIEKTGQKIFIWRQQQRHHFKKTKLRKMIRKGTLRGSHFHVKDFLSDSMLAKVNSMSYYTEPSFEQLRTMYVCNFRMLDNFQTILATISVESKCR